MFGLLVVDEHLLIIEITFTVIAPRSAEDFLDVRVIALLLAHNDKGEMRSRVRGQIERTGEIRK